MEMGEEKQVVIVTGASVGIGAALARRLAREGARVVLSARSEDKLMSLAQELGEDRTLVVPTDVARPEQCERLVSRAVERFGGIDILINNAGFGVYGLVEETSWEHFREMWEVNFFGAVRCTLAALPHLKARRGVVVNISSIAGKIPIPYMTGYCATKFALNAFSDGLRMEVMRAGVKVVTVCPGRVRTEFHVAARREGKNLPAVFQGDARSGIAAEQVVRATLKAVRRKRREVVLPWPLRLASAGRTLLPGLTERLMARYLR